MDLTEEEKKLEQEALETVDEVAVRSSIMADTGLSEEENKEQIDKLVAREVKQRAITAKAIQAKIKIRTEAQELRKNPPKGNDVAAEALDKALDEKLEKRDLESMEYPDELKTEIAKVAKILGVSIKKAVSDPYLASKIEAFTKEQKAEDAAVSRTHKSAGKGTVSLDNPPQVDFTTPEGQKEWEDWKAAVRKQGK